MEQTNSQVQQQVQQPTINLIPIHNDVDAEIARQNYVVDRYYEFHSSLRIIREAYSEINDITKKQQESINTVENNIASVCNSVAVSQKELEMADAESSAERKRKISITAGIVSGTLLTAVVAGATVAVPVGVAAGVAGWMLWRR